MAKMGRPKIEINEEELERLCRLHCTNEEIAAFFGCSVDTIERRFKENPSLKEKADHGKAMGKISLRRKQFQILEETNNTSMAIWLGKNILGQTDKVEMGVEVDASDKLSEAFSIIDTLAKAKVGQAQ